MFLKTWRSQLKLKEMILLSVLLLILLGNITDMVEDYDQEGLGFYFFVQVLTISLSIAGLYLLSKVLIHSYGEISSLTSKVEATENSLQKSSMKLKALAKDYNSQILEQFALWKLTPSEKEVALLLLKGLSLKAIAESRNRSAKTVRQQASTIYQKSSVAGRHEFSAWFFDDILKND